MNKITLFLTTIFHKIRYIKQQRCASLNVKNPKGSVLLYYLKNCVKYKDDDASFKFHTCFWECRQIAKIFNELGYNVDSISYDNEHFLPPFTKKYDAVFSAAIFIPRLQNHLDKNCLKLFYLLSSDHRYNNAAAAKRADDFSKRHNCECSNGRRSNEETAQKVDVMLEAADFCSIVGNDKTVSTYAQKFHSKMTKIPVTGSPVVKKDDEILAKGREFIWIGGSGIVHKGLDLVIDVFLKHPEWKLNVFGPIQNDPDFCSAYKDSIEQAANIKLYGFVEPGGELYTNVCKRSSYFIFPSCAEGTSTASVTAISSGLYPIISKDTGIDLPEGCGCYLETCSLEEIEQAVQNALNMPEAELKRQIIACRDFIINKHSRDEFTRCMREYLTKAMSSKNK